MELSTIPNNLDELLLTGTTTSGLKFILNPKPEFSKMMGVFGVRFGSTDNDLSLGGKGMEVPEGTAHFLEHKLFESKDGDVSDKFSANGASCNAGTGFTTTSYLFSCTEKLHENLGLLLEFVQSPYFTPELIAKEQGIIGQEIKMYNDDPDWIVFFNLMKCLYRDHPVRQNIAGTVASIKKIDPKVLHRCYRAFYRPGNMVLVLVGKMDTDEVSRIIIEDARNREKDGNGINRRCLVEKDSAPYQNRISHPMVVARPKILIGYKDPAINQDGRSLQAKEFITQIVLDSLFGKSSSNFDKLYGEGIIDDTFSAYYSGYLDFGFTSIGGDTDDPSKFCDRIMEIIEAASKRGLDPGDFNRHRNKYLGKFIRTFNSIESSAFSLMNFYYKGLNPNEVIEILKNLQIEALNTRLEEHLDPNFMACSIIEPSDFKSSFSNSKSP